MAKSLIKKGDHAKLYHDMFLIRKFEEKCAQLYGMGYIAGFCHLYIGQEAIVTGLEYISNPQDSSITTYRDHGHMLVSGMDPKRVMAELTGRIDGYSKGKGGSMHMFSKEKNFFGGHGIVGASAPIGAGIAFYHKYKKDGGMNFAYYGDGAANQGQVAEAYNMASLWKLPILFIIENNQYAMGMSNARSSAELDYSLRGVPYGIPGEKVDGMDVLDVIEKGSKAAKYIRDGKGPYLFDIWTYRYRGHSMSDPAKYRTREELEDVRGNRDCIINFKKYILDNNFVSESELKDIENEIKKQMKEVEEFAISSPEPEAFELYTDVIL